MGQYVEFNKSKDEFTIKSIGERNFFNMVIWAVSFIGMERTIWLLETYAVQLKAKRDFNRLHKKVQA